MVISLKKIIFQSFLLIALCSLWACQELPTELEETQDFKAVNDFSKTFISKMIAGDVEGCYQDIIPEVLNEETKTWFINASKNLAGAKIKKIKILGQFYNIRTFSYSDKKIISYEVAYELAFEQGGYGLFVLVIKQSDGQFLVKQVEANIFPIPIQEITKFTFDNKSWTHYIFIIVATLIAIFIIVTLVVLFISRISVGKKVLWAFLIVLLNYYRISINWSTGDIEHSFFIYGNNFTTFSFFNIPSVNYFKANLISPWFIFFHIPFGAILFWIRRKSLLKKSKSQKIEFEKSDLENPNNQD
ncbi:hypothetical protein AD998_10600 [bacterium 336/3]|nr:hypothetical protein AD998_10600 [bacterium 336/3]